jgi:hypothetical protein
MHTKFWSENLTERDHLEDPRVDGRAIFKRIFKKQIGRLWTGFIWLRIWGQWRALVNTVMNLRVP